MNHPLRSELERLKERQAQLHHAVDLLSVHISALEKRLALEAGSVDSKVGAPMAVPPLLPVAQPVTLERVLSAESTLAIAREQKPAHALEASIPSPKRVVAGGSEESQVPSVARVIQPPPLPPVAFSPNLPSDAPSKPESFEMRLGTYWLVRVGIVAMLTALVFFGTYAYQNYIGKLGAGGKVALLYLASGLLLGFGAWFQRRAAKEAMRNYAQVLLAGGMAAVYFTTYAAHHFPNLQVITNATLDGALLLGWAGFMAWMADRKKSEVFAMFAVGLAYYTSVITRVEHFTLYSNLVLAAVVLFFLVRNRWAKLSFGSLVATYASYGFWRFWQDGGWQWAEPGAGLWTGVYFLAAYWAVFTAAVFLSQHKEFAGVNRASFITLNNAAFYAMFLLTMFQVRSGGFWKFNLITGVALLGAAALARVRLREEPLAASTYLTQGLLLVTVGIIAKFSGLQLALVLGLESVVLWMTGTLRQNLIMRTGACVSAAMSTIWAFDGIERRDSHGAWLGAGVGALVAFNAFWSHWRGERAVPRLMRVSPTYFSALAIVIWTFAIWQNVAEVHVAAAFAIAAIVLAASVHLTRLRELGLLGQVLLLPAAMLLIANETASARPEPWWVFACVAGVAVALVHWWQKQTIVESPHKMRVAGQFVAALILVGATAFWLSPKLDLTQWVLATSALVLVLTAYGAVMRNWVLALVAQVFATIAVVNFGLHAGSEFYLSWLPALAPIAALTLLSVAVRRWAAACPSLPEAARWVRLIAVGYGRAAMAMVVWWTFQYVEARELAWSFTAFGVIAFALAGWRKGSDWLVFSTVLNLCALCSLVYHLMGGTAVYWPNFVAILVWMTEQQIARRQVERYPAPELAHHLAIVGAGAALWWVASHWVKQGFSGFYLTASWSVYAFALLGAGVLLRERMYRWVGLGVIAAAVGRVVIFDVWRLETIYRILSFFALGLVLLVLGFIYNKYQERIRQWL